MRALGAVYRRLKAFIAGPENKEPGELETMALESKDDVVYHPASYHEKKTYTEPPNIYDSSYAPGMIGSTAGPFPLGKRKKEL